MKYTIKENFLYEKDTPKIYNKCFGIFSLEIIFFNNYIIIY